jgi:23S rRNA (adenine2030-N6)-methyltransferase
VNYRHAFHAGNFADVVKHVVLTRILLYLQEKPAPFRFIDTHAGAGLYDLTSTEALRGGEWQDGIGRLLRAELSPDAASLSKPYLDIVRAFNPSGEPRAYPGSPLIARALLRPQDRLVACELEPLARRQLVDCLRRDRQARVVELDGWTALPAFVPPNERRGLVLIDPAFEATNEFATLAGRFAAAFAKWPSGSYMLWYPVKDLRTTRTFGADIARAVAAGKPATSRHDDSCLRVEFSVAPPGGGDATLRAAGLLIVNPPWTLAGELGKVLPALAAILGRTTGSFSLDCP